jgi:hypothetical protein
MSVKYFSQKENKWVAFPGVQGAPGIDSYQIAVENGYKGTYEDYVEMISKMPALVDEMESVLSKSADFIDPNDINASIGSVTESDTPSVEVIYKDKNFEFSFGLVRGEKGDKGDPGSPGENGSDGKDGQDGEDGKDGADGLPGKDGVDGKDGEDGKDGDGIQYIYYRNNGESIGNPTIENYMSDDQYQQRGEYNGVEYCPAYPWTDEPSGVNSENKYEWVSVRKYSNNSWGPYSNPKVWAKYGEDGDSGISVITKYSKTSGSDIVPDFNANDVNPGSYWTSNFSGIAYAYPEAVWSIYAYFNKNNEFVSIDGTSGWQGPILVTGTRGEQGIQGEAGPVGELGPQGPIGVTGVSMEFRYCKGDETNPVNILVSNTTSASSQDETVSPDGWSTTPPSQDELIAPNLYVWCIQGKRNNNEDGSYVITWENPFRISGLNGSEKGDQGDPGAVVYPAGYWNPSTTYIISDVCPYVYYEGNFYVLNTISSVGQQPDVNTDSWVKMDGFEAIYADVGVLRQALVGSAVFHGNYVYSQQGTNGDYTTSSIDNGFNPNIKFNFADGSGHLAGGNIKWDSDGDVVLKQVTIVGPSEKYKITSNVPYIRRRSDGSGKLDYNNTLGDPKLSVIEDGNMFGVTIKEYNTESGLYDIQINGETIIYRQLSYTDGSVVNHSYATAIDGVYNMPDSQQSAWLNLTNIKLYLFENDTTKCYVNIPVIAHDEIFEHEGYTESEIKGWATEITNNSLSTYKIKAENIDAGVISGDKITSGTISASVLDLSSCLKVGDKINLDGSTGSIAASQIDVSKGKITADQIDVNNLSVASAATISGSITIGQVQDLQNTLNTKASESDIASITNTLKSKADSSAVSSLNTTVTNLNTTVNNIPSKETIINGAISKLQDAPNGSAVIDGGWIDANAITLRGLDSKDAKSKITLITEDTLKTTNVVCDNLVVDASKITNISALKINADNITSGEINAELIHVAHPDSGAMIPIVEYIQVMFNKLKVDKVIESYKYEYTIENVTIKENESDTLYIDPGSQDIMAYATKYTTKVQIKGYGDDVTYTDLGTTSSIVPFTASGCGITSYNNESITFNPTDGCAISMKANDSNAKAATFFVSTY